MSFFNDILILAVKKFGSMYIESRNRNINININAEDH